MHTHKSRYINLSWREKIPVYIILSKYSRVEIESAARGTGQEYIYLGTYPLAHPLGNKSCIAQPIHEIQPHQSSFSTILASIFSLLPIFFFFFYTLHIIITIRPSKGSIRINEEDRSHLSIVRLKFDSVDQ